jgi:hypothetical protein
MTVMVVWSLFLCPKTTDRIMHQLKVPQDIIPEDVMFLLTEKAPYKVLWGGRGGYKTWSIGIALDIIAASKKTKILCCRETMKSMEDSVYALLCDQIERLGLFDEFEILKTRITHKLTGSEFIFDGIRDSTIDIKGKENVDICWIEEAEKLSKESWEKLDPTIRKEGAEVWVSFNTTRKSAFVYQRFIVNPPEGAIVHKTYYYNNPHLSETLRKKAEECKRNDPVGYRFIWLGEPSDVGGLIYPQFNRAVHVRNFNWNYLAAHGNIFIGMDPHKTAYPAVLFGAKMPINSSNSDFMYVIYNEFPNKMLLGGKLYSEVRTTARCGYTQKQLTGMFRALETTVGCTQVGNVNVCGRAADPYFSKGVGGSDWSSNTKGLVEEWSRPENGGLLWILPEAQRLSTQRNTINTLLDFNSEIPISSINDAKLFIMPHCVNLIDSMENHRTTDDKEVEDEQYKDFSDALRILMSIMYYTPYVDPVRRDVDAQLLTLSQRLQPLFFSTKEYAK